MSIEAYDQLMESISGRVCQGLFHRLCTEKKHPIEKYPPLGASVCIIISPYSLSITLPDSCPCFSRAIISSTCHGIAGYCVAYRATYHINSRGGLLSWRN